MVRVALVLVSHSRHAADGVAEIAAQMAPDVRILAAGGIDEGIGTSFDRVLDAVEEAAGAVSGQGSGVVVLTDLGSAVLTAESVLEAVDEEVAERVALADAPFVEGAVAAAVEAQQGADAAGVHDAAVRAGLLFATRVPGAAGPTPAGAVPAAAAADVSADADGPDGPGAPEVSDGSARATVVLPNPLGLHARPAALVARAVAERGVPLTVNGVNGASVLELMTLGAAGGAELVVEATGPGAQDAVDMVVAMVLEGFGEV